MPKYKEVVLYYYTREEGYARRVRLLKSIMVQMGIRIKTIEPEQVLEQVGYLAGIDGYSPAQKPEELPLIHQDILVLHNFTRNRMDMFLSSIRRANVPKIDLKAVITPQNMGWTFYHLYEELMKEHKEMHSLPR